MSFVSFLKTLEPKDWEEKVTDRWTVKDVVAHMIGWEKIDPEEIQKAWATGKAPWFTKTNDYKDFNQKAIIDYKDCQPKELISEWEFWQEKVASTIKKIGYENIKSRPDLFGWLLEAENNSTGESNHYNHHLKQVKKALGREK